VEEPDQQKAVAYCLAQRFFASSSFVLVVGSSFDPFAGASSVFDLGSSFAQVVGELFAFDLVLSVHFVEPSFVFDPESFVLVVGVTFVGAFDLLAPVAGFEV
jgi:hypothetical protein